MAYGPVKNVGQQESTTTVKLALVFAVDPTVGTGTITGLAASLGGAPLSATDLEFDVVENVSVSN